MKIEEMQDYIFRCSGGGFEWDFRKGKGLSVATENGGRR
jgi:hypothetical protein